MAKKTETEKAPATPAAPSRPDHEPRVGEAEPAPVADHEFHVCCQKCAHTWVAAYLPMRLEVFATLIGSLHCAKCGIGSQHIVWMQGGIAIVPRGTSQTSGESQT